MCAECIRHLVKLPTSSHRSKRRGNIHDTPLESRNRAKHVAKICISPTIFPSTMDEHRIGNLAGE